MQIIVTHKETIKPSSPTPDPLRTLRLSLLDQTIATFPEQNTRALMFFSAQGDVRRFENTNMSCRLKKSLSVTLTEFYPFAGRFNSKDQNLACNGSGVEYIEARVRAPLVLDQLIGCPNAEELNQLYPPDTRSTQVLCSVQVTVFEGCGSMVIGVRASHLIGDTSALAKFIESWSTIARGGKIASPKFGLADVFPPSYLFAKPWSSDDETTPQHENLDQVQKLITKRFVLNKSEIAALLANCGSPSTTRVQVACALIFKCLVNVIRLKSSKPVFMFMPISLSRKMSPPVPPNCVGNFACSQSTKITEPESFHGLVLQVSEMIRKIDSEYLKALFADEAKLLFDDFQQQKQIYMENEAHFVEISSMCRLPFYETDFGWGRPMWATVFFVNIENLVTILDTENGNGIEAWVTLNQEDMKEFESEYALLLHDLGKI